MFMSKNRFEKASDEELMQHIQKRDVTAFNELYRRYSQRLLHYFYRMLAGNEDKARDFLQDTFTKLIEKRWFFDTNKRFSTWIFTMAHNLCKNEYRRLEVRNRTGNKAESNRIFNESESFWHQTDQHIDQSKFRNALAMELEKLNPQQRSVFVLRFQQGLSIKEISEILSCPEGTIKSRLFYTTAKLASRLQSFNPNNNEVE